MRASLASLPTLWALAACAFSTPVQAQTPERNLVSFMNRPHVVCTATTSQFRMDVADQSTITNLMHATERDAAASETGKSRPTDLPRIVMMGVTVTTGGATSVAGRFNLVEDANIAWMNEMKPVTETRPGIEEQTHLHRIGDGSFRLRVYQDMEDNLGAPRQLVSPLSDNIEGYRAVAARLIMDGRKLALQICNKERKRSFPANAYTLFNGKKGPYIAWSSGDLDFNDSRLDRFKKKFGLMLDFAGAPRTDTAVPQRIIDPATATLTQQAMYILGFSGERPANFDRKAKCGFQAELTRRTGLKTTKTGRPDCRVGPVTAIASQAFLKKEYNL